MSAIVGDELAPYFLRNVEGIEEAADKEERRLGSGSYGYVFKVIVDGMECIAKRLHSAMTVSVSLQQRQAVTSKFRNECIILSKLRHPNIVQFVGVHYGSKSTQLTLIMECAKCDLDQLILSDHSNVPLPLKLSILLDISYGLLYLHEYSPPIIHRDLTARNILISDQYRAKIADLGVAKIVDFHEQLAKTHTQAPGQQFFMPPEALKENAECTPKLDVFSFGHLTLLTIIQEYPTVHHVTLSVDMQTKGLIERSMRSRALTRVGTNHCLYPMIIECLYDRPDQRPTTRDLNRRIKHLYDKHPVSGEGCKNTHHH